MKLKGFFLYFKILDASQNEKKLLQNDTATKQPQMLYVIRVHVIHVNLPLKSTSIVRMKRTNEPAALLNFPGSVDLMWRFV